MKGKYVTLTVNQTLAARAEKLHGRDYLVAPVTMMVPGVLNGSRGPIYYPLEEVCSDPGVWNHIPITVYHPKINGRNVSARDPLILDRYGIGMVLRSSASTKLKAEAWFDKEATKSKDIRVYNALITGTPLELSTGLFLDTEDAPEGAVFNGKPYDFTARNYKPDHLAVLPDQIGACSLKDGCGLFVNQSGEKRIYWSEVSMSKPEPIINRLPKNQSFEDVGQALRSAFREAHPYKYDVRGMLVGEDCWVVSIFDGYFIYREGEEMYRQNYTVDKQGVVTIDGKPESVSRVVKYVPTGNTDTAQILWTESKTTKNLNQNSTQNTTPHKKGADMGKLTENERRSIIVDLTTNCDCWRHAGDGEVLATFTDEKLLTLKEHAEKEKQAFAVANAAVRGYTDSDGKAYRVNPETGKWEFGLVQTTNPAQTTNQTNNQNGGQGNQNDDGDDADNSQPKKKGKRVTNTDDDDDEPIVKKPKTLEDHLRGLPVEVQNTIRVAQELEQREKDKIIAQLLVNVADSDKRAHYERLRIRALDDLRNDLSLMPKQPTKEELARVAPQTNQSYGNYQPDDDMLQMPVINWREADSKGDASANNSSTSSGVQRQAGLPNLSVPNTAGNGPYAQPQSDEDVIRQLPPHLRSIVQNAAQIESRERRQLIKDIVTNANLDEETEKRVVNELNTKSLQELRTLQLIVPKREPTRANYFGASTPSSLQANQQRANDVNEDILTLPKVDWSKQA